MQKIEIFIGSPRKNGNTAQMAQMLSQHLDEKEFQIDTTFLYDFSIKPCVDCKACKKGKMVCVLKDDMNPIYQKMDAADIIIIGTPIYWFGPSAQAKLMIDRFRPYYVNKKLSGKKAALLLPAGTGEKDCDLTIEMCKRTFDALEITNLGSATAEAYDIGDVNQDNHAKEEIRQLAENMK